MVNEDIRAIVEAELEPGEKLLWADRPHVVPLSIRSIGYFIICLLILAMLWVASHLPSNRGIFQLNPNVFNLVWQCFVVIMAVSFVLQWVWGVVQEATKTYAITSRRILVLKKIGKGKIVQYTSKNLKDVETIKTDKYANIYLKLVPHDDGCFARYFESRPSLESFVYKDNIFREIPNPREVEALIRSTFLNKGHTP